MSEQLKFLQERLEKLTGIMTSTRGVSQELKKTIESLRLNHEELSWQLVFFDFEIREIKIALKKEALKVGYPELIFSEEQSFLTVRNYSENGEEVSTRSDFELARETVFQLLDYLKLSFFEPEIRAKDVAEILFEYQAKDPDVPNFEFDNFVLMDEVFTGFQAEMKAGEK